jgi:hypothetical protein
MSETNTIKASSERKLTPPPKLAINFLKSAYFRVVHASGVWYGGDGQGNLHLTFFNERNPIPKTVVLDINEHGMVVGEDLSKRDTKQGIVREMEVDVIFSFDAAMEFHKTLGENLKAIQEQKGNKAP